MDQSTQLHLVVIGAGLAGLSASISTALAGHRCTVLEKVAAFLPDVGAGLQLTPNATRLLRCWGVADECGREIHATAPESLIVRRFDGSRVLSREDAWSAKMQQRYAAPFWDVHRADLLAALLERARQLGVRVRTGAEVEDVDFARATVALVGGERVQGDVVLAADGLWSRARRLLLCRREGEGGGGGGVEDVSPSPTGDLAYRIILRRDDLEKIGNSELLDWVARPAVHFWIGPYAHAVAYFVRGGQELNMVLLCLDDLPEGCTRVGGDVDEMKRRFLGWDPV